MLAPWSAAFFSSLNWPVRKRLKCKILHSLFFFKHVIFSYVQLITYAHQNCTCTCVCSILRRRKPRKEVWFVIDKSISWISLICSISYIKFPIIRYKSQARNCDLFLSCHLLYIPGVAQLMETALFFVSAVFLADCSSLVLISGFWVMTTCERTTVHTILVHIIFFKSESFTHLLFSIIFQTADAEVNWYQFLQEYYLAWQNQQIYLPV